MRWTHSYSRSVSGKSRTLNCGSKRGWPKRFQRRMGGGGGTGLLWDFCSQVDHAAVQQLMLGVGRPVLYQSNCVLVIGS